MAAHVSCADFGRCQGSNSPPANDRTGHQSAKRSSSACGDGVPAESRVPDELLHALSSGDQAAADKLFAAYHGFLRTVVRRHISRALRCRFDSEDVVQSTWVGLLRGLERGGWHFEDDAHLRAFLATAVRHRLLNRVRHEQSVGRLECSVGAAPHRTDPDPVADAEAADAWRRLLSLCPAAHHDVLRLKRQGLTIAEIATQTRLHPGSVRRLLYQVARKWADKEAQRRAGQPLPPEPPTGFGAAAPPGGGTAGLLE